MKKLISLAILWLLLSASSASAQLVTNFSDWTLWICKPNGKCEQHSGALSGTMGISGSDWSASMDVDNGKLTFTVDGSDDDGIWVGLTKNFGTPGYAIIANFKVKQINGNAFAGIYHSIEEWPIEGIEEDEAISVVRMRNWNNCKEFAWEVRERSDDKSYQKRLSIGNFGNYCGQWNVNDNKFLGYALFMNEMWFWVDGYKALNKFTPMVPFSSNQAMFDPAIEVFVDQGNSNSITVEVDSINVF